MVKKVFAAFPRVAVVLNTGGMMDTLWFKDNPAVGAALLSEEGRYYAGCNTENVSYPVGTCAETGAIAAMTAAGDRRIAEMLVLADGNQLITPCGACRQRIKEFASPHTPVHLASPQGIVKTLTLEELLPYGFNDGKLTHD